RAELEQLGQRRDRERASGDARQDIHQADGGRGCDQVRERQDHHDPERRRLNARYKGAGSMATAAAAPDLEPASSFLRRRWLSGQLFLYALITPSVAVIAGVLAFPLGMLVWLSLQHYGLRELIAHQGEWVGLGNYQAILADPLF